MLASPFLNSDKTVPSSAGLYDESISDSSSGVNVELIIEFFLGFGVSRWGNLSRLINFNIIFIIYTYISSSSSNILNSRSTIIYMILHVSPSLLLLLLHVYVVTL